VHRRASARFCASVSCRTPLLPAVDPRATSCCRALSACSAAIDRCCARCCSVRARSTRHRSVSRRGGAPAPPPVGELGSRSRLMRLLYSPPAPVLLCRRRDDPVGVGGRGGMRETPTFPLVVGCGEPCWRPPSNDCRRPALPSPLPLIVPVGVVGSEGAASPRSP